MGRKQGVRRSLLIGCVAVLLAGQTVYAKEGGNEKNYTYTVTLYSGNQGEFKGTEGIQVDNHTTGSAYQITNPKQDNGQIRITGLQYGDMVMVNAQSCTSLAETSRYYVGGIRESGRDNNAVGASAFRVESDREYVAAYGIKGDMVSYVVNYQDESGNALAESQTFYGTVGDSPVAAFQYIENYQPQAYNLTKTLSSNEAENVFTFVYQEVSPQAGQNPQDGGTDTAAGGDADGNAGAADNGNPGGNADGAADGNAGNADGAADGNVDGNDGAGNNGEADGNGGNADGENGLVNSEDEQTPQDLVNLDDEETPLANIKAKEAGARPVGNMPVFLGIAAAAVAGIAVLGTVLLKKKKKKGKAENESEREEKKEEKNSGDSV